MLSGRETPSAATRTLLEGLSLWRGPVLADFALDPFAQSEIARLEEARVTAIEERVEADLALGRHRELIGELETMIGAHPLRERLRGQLMLALYRSERQAEALAAYQDARRLLDEELGLEPSESLQQLERAILVHDPALDLPEPAAVPAADQTALADELPRRRSRWRHGVVLAAVAGVAALLAGVSVLALSDRKEAKSIAAAAGNSVGVIDPESNELVADVAVGATPTRLVVADGAYWVTNADDHTVSRVDPATRAVVQTVRVGSSPSGITTGEGDVWVANSLDGTVSRIDAETNTVVQTIEAGNFPLGIAYANGAIWVANSGDDTIGKIDAGTGKPLRTLPIMATELAPGAHALWASQRTSNRVVRIDPRSGAVVQEVSVGGGPTGIDVGAGSVWVANSLDGTVSRIDPETSSVTATIPTGDGPTALAADEDGVWVSNQFDGTVVRIDPKTNNVVRRISVGNRPQGVAVAGGDVLVEVRASDTAHRGGTLTVRNDRSPDSIDPAVAYDPASWPYLRMTNDGLVAFNQVAGVAGTQLVPDLAVSLPTPTDGGRSYTFQLRPGIRYSNGQPVRASHFRATFERDFRVGLQVTYYDGIIGAARCKRVPAQCDLSRGIVTDDAAGTISFHLLAPDPEFLYRLAISAAYVVPPGTRPRDIGARPVPATGPYMIAEYRPNRILRLERNPHFNEWSKAAQPDGYPDRIVLTLGGTADEAIDDVIRGRADLMSTLGSGSPTPRRLASIKTRNASQVHTNPAQQTANLFLNTRVAPFDRLDVRQGGELCGRPRRGGPDPGWLRPRGDDVPGASPSLPGLPSLLPVHGKPDLRRGLDGPRPRQGTTTREPLRHAGHEGDRLGLRARGGLRSDAGEAPRCARVPDVAEDTRRHLQRDRLRRAHESDIGSTGWGTDYPLRLDLVERAADVRLLQSEDLPTGTPPASASLASTG